MKRLIIFYILKLEVDIRTTKNTISLQLHIQNIKILYHKVRKVTR